MGITWVITGAIVSYCASQIGGSVGAASFEIIKKISNYVWLKPEEGYYLDYPDDPDNGKKDLRTIIKRLKRMVKKNEK